MVGGACAGLESPRVGEHHRVVVEVDHLAAWESLLRSLVSGIGGGQADAEQELWALLAVCQALRMTMTAAAEAAGADPDRASLTAALESAREQVITARGIEDSGSPRRHRPGLLPARRLQEEPHAFTRARRKYSEVL